jgi:hypothetical protein
MQLTVYKYIISLTVGFSFEKISVLRQTLTKLNTKKSRFKCCTGWGIVYAHARNRDF